MTLVQANNTYAQIELLVRRLTASPGEDSLKSVEIQQLVNTFYNADLPYAIKLDAMRSVYTFYTRPYIDRYPMDLNYNQGFRAPVYVDGIQGWFYTARDEFYNIWPKWPTKFTPISGDGVTQSFSFSVPGPFLSLEVTLGAVDTTGAAISIQDDGNGNLNYIVPNPVVSVPVQPVTPPNNSPPLAGMLNMNTANPGLSTPTRVGTVNYVTGACTLNLALAGVTPAAGSTFTMWVSQYQTGRPFSLLIWNNQITIRPVPKLIHRIDLEAYLSPVQFMQTTDSPILNQWVQYISYGVAREILRQRQDMEGVANLEEGFKRQEGLALERQGVDEIGNRNRTIFSASQMTQGINQGWIQGWY